MTEDMEVMTALDDSGFAGSPQPSGESQSTPSTLGSDTGISSPSLLETVSY